MRPFSVFLLSVFLLSVFLLSVFLLSVFLGECASTSSCLVACTGESVALASG